MANCDDEVTSILGDVCVKELKDAADSDWFTKQNCLSFAYKISKDIGGEVNRDIKSNGYRARDTIAMMLGLWYSKKPEDICVSKVLKILRSDDFRLNAIAMKIGVIHTAPNDANHPTTEDIAEEGRQTIRTSVKRTKDQASKT